MFSRSKRQVLQQHRGAAAMAATTGMARRSRARRAASGAPGHLRATPALFAMFVALLLVCGTAAAARQQSSSTTPSAFSWLRSAWDSAWAWAWPTAPSGTGSSSGGSDDSGPVSSVQWALLIAGSSGWWNYRHQADVLHAYQVLRGGGLHPDRIVLMVFDDLATNPSNPFKGQIFNRPGGADVYAGVHIDYSGNDVNADVFLAVLEGNKSAVAGIGSGKVIASGPNDHVFLFYSDHGSPGVLGMPTGNFLFADDLNAVLRRKHAARGFRELTAYIEACESGSMFEGLLGPELNVYATTAANAEESSWGTYCPGMDIPPDLTGLDTCLGDLYSVAWMEDTECEDTTVETLQDQFELVKLRTSHNYTYNMGSHVMQYGSTAMETERVAEYLGPREASACMLPSDDHEAQLTPAGVRALLGKPRATAKCPAGKRCRGPLHARAHTAHAPQRDADLMPLRVRLTRAKTPEQRQRAQAELDVELSRRRQVDTGLEAATARLLSMRDASKALMSSLGWRPEKVFRTAAHQASGDNRLVPEAEYVQQLLSSPSLLGRGSGSGKPLVDSWACLKGMVAAYADACSPRSKAMDQYAMRHTRLFANLCNAGVQPSELAQALRLANGCPTVERAEEGRGGSNDGSGVAAQ